MEQKNRVAWQGLPLESSCRARCEKPGKPECVHYTQNNSAIMHLAEPPPFSSIQSKTGE